MTDEFNLVPTNNLEKHLDNILRAASGDEPQYDLAPNWRVEQYLAAIAAKLPGGGGLPPVTASDAGKVATVDNSGVWGAENEVFYFDVAYNSSDGSYTAQSVNREELVDAINKGKRFAMRYTDENHLTTIIDVQSFGTSSTEKSANALFIGVATISDNSDTGFTTINLFASVSPDEDPSVTETDVVALILNHDNRFIVTLTPTAQDYSGTMDKTVAEIKAAYEAEQQIVFRVMMSATKYMDVDCTARYFTNGNTYPSFNAYIVGDGGVLIYAFTSTTDDGTKQTYATEIYTLTPAT